MYDMVKLICSFIDPGGAEKHFAEAPVPVENTGFDNDLRSIDPKFDLSKYSELLD